MFNYITQFQKGINLWTKEEYRDASSSIMNGLEHFTSLRITDFFLVKVTPGTNLLGTICDGLNEGKRLWARLYPVFSKNNFPIGCFHIGYMAALQRILLEVTSSNVIITNNAKGYKAMAELDGLYNATLKPADRRTLHRRITSPIFEQVIGRALAYDIDIAVDVAEHCTSPMAKDILGSLYSNEYGIEPSYLEEFEAARKMRISECIEANQEIIQNAVDIIQKSEDSSDIKEIMDNETAAFQSRGDFDSFIYNELKLDRELSIRISGMPQANILKIRNTLRKSEALVLSSAYEDNFIFFVISKEYPTECYIIRSFGSLGPGLRNVLKTSSSAYDLTSGLVTNLYSRVNTSINPILDYLNLKTRRKSKLKKLNFEDTLRKLLTLLDAEPPQFEKKPHAKNFGECLRKFKSIHWVLTFPLNNVPMQLVCSSLNGNIKTCSFSPSSTVLVGLRNIHKKDHKISKALVFSNPTLDLVGSADEGKYVTELLRKNGVEVTHKNGPEATREYLLKNLEKFDMFHYSGHSESDDLKSFKPILNLPDKSFELTDIIKAKPNLKFVFLNSCSSGTQKSRPYGEHIGIAHIFLSSGVASVIAPIRPVSDKFAFNIAKRIYYYLEKGLSVGRAIWRINKRHQTTKKKTYLLYRQYGLPELVIFKKTI